MNDREKLLKRLQICDFILIETNLYLDSHPEDEAALAYFMKYRQLAREAEDEFVSKYGPITAGQHDGGPRWNWVDDPWPWEGAK